MTDSPVRRQPPEGALDIHHHGFLTLRAQGLLERAPRHSLLSVARRLCAIQAQIPSTPLLSLAARVEGIEARDLERELSERKALLRVWSLRLTLHVIAADDLPLIFAAVMRDGYDAVVRMLRKHDGLSPGEIRAAERAMMREFEKGPLTRSELRRAIPGFRVKTYWGREIRCLAQKGLVVHAGTRGGEAVFELRERWAPRCQLGKMTTREARRELLLRYLDAYGSGTPADFAYWLGIRVRDVQQAFQDAGNRVREEVGVFVRRGDDHSWSSAPVSRPRLLPRYDGLLLGHRDKSRYLAAQDYKKVFRPSAVIEAIVLVGGRVAGTWDYEDPQRWRAFQAIPQAQRRVLREEAARVRALMKPPSA